MCQLYRIVGGPLLRGFEYIKVYENTIRTFIIVLYITVKRGSTVIYNLYHLYLLGIFCCCIVRATPGVTTV